MSETIGTTAPSARISKTDWRARLAAATIPESAKKLIEQVVRKTRLRRAEQAAVTGELIAHFADAIDAGVTPERAIEKFGDTKQAAKLIRRAKIRNRSYVWHAWRWLRRAVLALVMFYICVGIYFVVGRPTPSVDYVAKMNEATYRVSRDQWAWPLYRPVAAAFRGDPMPNATRPKDEKWNDTVAWLERHPNELAALRAAASKPILGRPLGLNLTPEDATALGFQQRDADPSLAGQSLIGVLLPHLNHMRAFCNALAADAAQAVRENDADRTEKDIQAIFGLSSQLRKHDVLVSDLVSVGCYSLALHGLGEVLNEKPQLLSTEALVRLLHRVAGPRDASDLMSFNGERYMFYDVAQRVYTDDGNGDGRITRQGIAFFGELQPMLNMNKEDVVNQSLRDSTLIYTFGPAAMLMTASRKELIDEYNLYIDAQERRLRVPLRDVATDEPEQRIMDLKRDLSTSIRYSLITILAPALTRTQVTAERALGQQEGLTVALALELYKRSNGDYPATLEVLSPRYLPTIPADRIDGQPVRYKIVDGKPVIYSVGVDRDDDGGRVFTKDGVERNYSAAEWGKHANVVDADWILFPPH